MIEDTTEQATLRLTGYTFLVAKLGDEPKHCQDALQLDASTGVIAVADGLSTAFFAGAWARCLTKNYVKLRGGANYDVNDWLRISQQEWKKEVEAQISGRETDVFSQMQMREGDPGRSTFLGVRLHRHLDDQGSLQLEVEGVGDTCLMHFSQGLKVWSFPLEKAAEFKPATRYVSSNFVAEGFPLHSVKFGVNEGDCIVLATDAFAKFVMAAFEQKSELLNEFFTLKTTAELQSFIARCRAIPSGLILENDDIALAALTCTFGPGQIEDLSPRTNDLAQNQLDLEKQTIQRLENEMRSMNERIQKLDYSLKQLSRGNQLGNWVLWLAGPSFLLSILAMMIALYFSQINRSSKNTLTRAVNPHVQGGRSEEIKIQDQLQPLRQAQMAVISNNFQINSNLLNKKLVEPTTNKQSTHLIK